MRSSWRRSLAVVAMIGLGACGGEEPGAEVKAGSMAIDSAGVTVVTNVPRSDDAGTGWRLGDAPVLDIGSLDGAAAEQFFQVSDGVVLSDGGFVVAGFGSNDLRRFDKGGNHLWTVGREGDGPGEFQGLILLAPGPGDTLFTYDFRQRRISRWAPDGTFVDSRQVEGIGDDGIPFVETVLPDGRAVYSFMTFDFEDPPDQGDVRRDPIEVRVATPGDTAAVPIGEFAGREVVIYRQSETAAGARLISGSPPFARGTYTAGDEGGVWIGDSEHPEIRRYGLDGTLQRIVRLPIEPVPVTPELIRNALAAQLEEAGDDEERDLARQRWEELPMPETLPYFESLEIDRDANLWVRGFQPPGASVRTWYVLSAGTGELIAIVRFPDRTSPLEIGPDYVLARYGDELDVEHVQLWELIKE